MDLKNAPISDLQSRSRLLAEEIDDNEEETRMMRDELTTIQCEISDRTCAGILGAVDSITQPT